MVERPIKKSDLPPEESAKTDRPERKEKRSRDRKDNREDKKPPIPPALLRGPKPQPKKETPPEPPADSSDTPREEVEAPTAETSE